MSQCFDQPEFPDLDTSVTVVVVSFNSGDYLQPCVDALANQTFRDFQAVIVDNASTDGSADRLVIPDGRFVLVRLNENVGFAAANNFVAQRVKSPYLVTLNPDTIATDSWLERLTAGARRWPEAGAFGSTQVQLDDPQLLDGAGDEWHAAGVGWRALEGHPVSGNRSEGETFSPCAAAALYRRELFLELGGFDEAFFCYCEDIDLGFRLRLRGYPCAQIPDAVVFHAGSGTTGKVSEFTLFHGHRNRVWVFMKNTPGWLMWVLWPWHIYLNRLMLASAPSEEYRRILRRAYDAAWAGRRQVLRERVKVQRGRRLSILEFVKVAAWRREQIVRRAPLRQ